MGTEPAELRAEIGDLGLRYFRSGSGPTAIKLHHSTGNPGWMPVDEVLAEEFDLIVPDLPGYNQSDRPAWARSVRDIAVLTGHFIETLELEDVVLIGCGLGGWVAAELASMNNHAISHLIVTGAPGLKPNEGLIEDQIKMDWDEYVQLSFSSNEHYEQTYGPDAADVYKELWDYSREMTARLTWKPWMYNRSLEPLLSLVDTSALVVWGSDDRIVPQICGEQYKNALTGSKLEIVEGAGHCVEHEQPEIFRDLISSFVKN